MRPGPESAIGVADLTAALKRMIEDGFPAVWVRGEVSNLRKQASGHSYFSLKDERSQIPAVLFRGNAMRIEHELAAGQQVIAFGEVSVYEPRGSYQLIVRDLVEDGIGRLQREFERLKERLRAEGLFAAERKKPLPALPLAVGVVTSPSGAAVRDIISVLKRRDWRGSLRIFPSLVQGASAAASVAAQVERAGRMADLDLLVIARGGGSLEDLWCFNDETLARVVADCPIPTVSAIGHETDVVLTDFVADLRKETPTGAAEWITSAHAEARHGLSRIGADLNRSVAEILDRRREALDRIRSRAVSRPFLRRIETGSQRMDEWRERIVRAVDRRLAERLGNCRSMGDRLARRRPDREWEARRREIQNLAARLAKATDRSLLEKKKDLERLVVALRTGGLDGTLRRGFAVVRDSQGRPKGRAAAIADGEELTLQFQDGRLAARAGKLPD